MKIGADGWLTQVPRAYGFTRAPLPPTAGAFAPEGVCVHYGVTHSLDALVAAQVHQKFGAHFSVDGFREGERSHVRITQHTPATRRAAHAGASEWNGRKGCNAFLYGIEIANPGYLIERDDGKLFTSYGKPWPRDEAVHARHKNLAAQFRWWAAYTEEELDVVIQLCDALRDFADVHYVVGHDDIAPSRKLDPGPAWPMGAVREALGW